MRRRFVESKVSPDFRQRHLIDVDPYPKGRAILEDGERAKNVEIYEQRQREGKSIFTGEKLEAGDLSNSFGLEGTSVRGRVPDYDELDDFSAGQTLPFLR